MYCTVVQCLLFVHKHAMGHNSACFFSEFSHEINEKTVLNFIKLLTARSLSLGNRCPTVGGKKADASATIHFTYSIAGLIVSENAVAPYTTDSAHCPKNNLKLHCHGWNRCNSLYPGLFLLYSVQNPDIYR